MLDIISYLVEVIVDHIKLMTHYFNNTLVSQSQTIIYHE